MARGIDSFMDRSRGEGGKEDRKRNPVPREHTCMRVRTQHSLLTVSLTNESVDV